MNRIKTAMIAALVIAASCLTADAQLLRRTCPTGGCPQMKTPVVQPAQPIVQTKVDTVDAVIEVTTARATTPHVRCIYNGSCGSGTICGADQRGAYVLTNAHVVGTPVGRVANVDVVTARGTVRVRGRIVMSGYSDRTMVDFAILHCEGLTSDRYMPLLKTEPTGAPYATIGSPRCVWPQVRKAFNDPRNYGQGLITGSPDAIGGQSGSAIFNSSGQQIALLTWSIGGRCAGQKTSKLWQVASQRNIELADPRVEGMMEVDELTRPETQVGIHGSIIPVATTTNDAALPAAKNQAPSSLAKIGKLENGIQNVVGSAMEDLPIWFDPTKPNEPTQPPTTQPPATKPPVPVPPVDEDCRKLTDKEWELIQFLRKQAEQDGEVADRDWLALLLRVMPIIIDLIKALQQSK